LNGIQIIADITPPKDSTPGTLLVSMLIGTTRFGNKCQFTTDIELMHAYERLGMMGLQQAREVLRLVGNPWDAPLTGTGG